MKSLTLTIELTREQLEAIAERVAELLTRQPVAAPEWLNTTEAAQHLACKPARIHDLVQLGHLEPRRDGRRLLFRRRDLDGYLDGGAREDKRGSARNDCDRPTPMESAA